MRRKVTAAMMAVITIFSFCANAWAWNGISHYHINHGVGIEPVSIFGINGTGPDMSVQWIGKDPKINDEKNNEQSWPDYFHSPNPKYENKERQYADKPNFAYLMLKASEKNGVASEDAKARALGWGGHIAADWVAHNDNLFPICPEGSRGELKHFIGECLCEFYSFLTYGPIGSISDLSVAFDDKQIYKALYNYRLISIHERYIEEKRPISDKTLKDIALQTTLPKSTIRERIKRWVAKLAVLQFAYSCQSAMWDSSKRNLFLDEIERRGVKSNLSLSEMSVNSWINNMSPRGHIPDYSDQVVPFYAEKLMNIPKEASLSRLGQGKSAASLQGDASLPSAGSLRAATSQQEKVYRAAQSIDEIQGDGLTIDENIDEKDIVLWLSIIDASSQKGYLTVEETETAEGLYQVDVKVRDRDGLWNLVKEEIQRFSNSTTDDMSPYHFWDNLLVEGISEPDLLADSSPPSLTLIAPADKSFVNTAMPEIIMQVEDGPGVGVEPGRVSLNVDGKTVSPNLKESLVSYRPSVKLKEGAHSVLAQIIDKAGNVNSARWSFTVDSISPKLCCKIKSKSINSRKKKIEIAITPNEPVNYLMAVYPVVDERAELDSAVFRQKFEQQKMISWNGYDNHGFKVAKGTYEVRIHAIDRAGNNRVLKFDIKVED